MRYQNFANDTYGAMESNFTVTKLAHHFSSRTKYLQKSKGPKLTLQLYLSSDLFRTDRSIQLE